MLDGQGERWVQAQLLGALLDNMAEIVDQDALVGMLSNHDLTDGAQHSSWEELAATAIRAAELEIRSDLRERIKQLVRNLDERSELSTIDARRLLTLLGMSGPRGLDLLVEIACDAGAEVDARIDAAMTTVSSDVGRVNELEGLLDDDELPSAVRERLGVAFAMLGAPEMLPRVVGILPASEPAYVALRSILRGEAITYEVIQHGVTHGREALQFLRHTPQPTWDLDFAALAREFEFRANSQTEQNLRLKWITDELRGRTYGRLLSLLLASERVALYRVGGFIDNDATRNWLATWIPGYRELASAEMERFAMTFIASPRYCRLPQEETRSTSLSI